MITICFTVGSRDRKLRGPCSFFAPSGELVSLKGWDPGNEPRLAGFAPKVGMAMKSLDDFTWSETLEGIHRLHCELMDNPVPILVYRKDGPVYWNPEKLVVEITYEDETVLRFIHKKGEKEQDADR